MRSVQTTALSELAQLRPHARNTAMSLPNVFGVRETEFSDQPSLSSEAFHSPPVSATPPPRGQGLGVGATGKENHWHGASITPIGILLGPTHTYLGRDLTHGPYSTSSSASCMRHATARVHVNTDAEIGPHVAEAKHEPQTPRTQTPLTRKTHTS